jgi:hypothetical protein
MGRSINQGLFSPRFALIYLGNKKKQVRGKKIKPGIPTHMKSGENPSYQWYAKLSWGLKNTPILKGV